MAAVLEYLAAEVGVSLRLVTWEFIEFSLSCLGDGDRRGRGEADEEAEDPAAPPQGRCRRRPGDRQALRGRQRKSRLPSSFLQDFEFSICGAQVVIPGAGVTPGIHAVLARADARGAFTGWSRQDLSVPGQHAMKG